MDSYIPKRIRQVHFPSPPPTYRKPPLTFSSVASDSGAPESSPRAIDSGSQSSTILNPSSYSGSMMTLLNETSIYEIPEDLKDPKAQKESIRYTSPLVRAISPALSPCIMSPRKQKLPFAPEDLTRALIAVQVCA